MLDALLLFIVLAIVSVLIAIWFEFPRNITKLMVRRNGGFRLFLIILLAHLIITAALTSIALFIAQFIRL